MMRQEQDALGDIPVPSSAYFGASTVRLTEAVAISGLGYLPGIPLNVLKIRQAQAIAYGRNKTWNNDIAFAIKQAAQRLISGEIFLMDHLKVLPQHGGGVRSIVLNVDEVLANLALEELGISKGDFHHIAPLFHMDRGRNYLDTYMTAVHIALLEELKLLNTMSESLLLKLIEKSISFQMIETVTRIQFQDIELSNVGACFSRLHESLGRSFQQLDWLRTRLYPCWQGSSDVLLALREVVEIDITMNSNPYDFPWNVDLYLDFSALFRTMALTLLGFCKQMHLMISSSKELETQRIRANSPFNPDGRELIIPDTISQLAFSIIGGDAAIVAATSGGGESSISYAPFLTSQLLWCAKWLISAIQLLDQKFVSNLVGNDEAGRKALQETPLQAERLIPVLGYERAVQVARIAALTQRPVRMVVQKMKLMTQEESDNFFLPAPYNPDKSNT